MALPLWMLHTLHMRLKQKIGSGALFSLATIGILAGIMRTVYSIRDQTSASICITVLLNILELELAVIISTLVTYRIVFNKDTKKQKQKPCQTLARSRSNSLGRTPTPSNNDSDYNMPSAKDLAQIPKLRPNNSSRTESGTSVAPMESAHIV